jgi:CRP-like cAMP-binding protein
MVERIVITFKNRYEELASNLHQLGLQVSSTQLMTQEIIDKTAHLRNHYEKDQNSSEDHQDLNKDLTGKIITLQDEVKRLKETQETFQSKFLMAKPKTLSATMKGPSLEIETQLTQTENIILHYLLSEGPKTAKDVEEKIGKTREHTARLMKKLWQQGYVERETHKIPFTYKTSGALRNFEKSST